MADNKNPFLRQLARLGRRGGRIGPPIIGGGGGGGGGAPTTPAFVTDTNVKAIQSMSRPALRAPTDVLGFGGSGGTVAAKITRESDWTMQTDNVTQDDNLRASGMGHEYGKMAVINSDRTRIALLNFGGAESGGTHVRNRSDGSKIGSTLFPPGTGYDLEFNFHPTNPDLALYQGGNNPCVLREWNYNGGSPTTNIKATPKDPAVASYFSANTGQEGRFSHDYTRIALRCRRGSASGISDVVVWNFQTDSLVGRRPAIQSFQSVASVGAAGSGYNVGDQFDLVGGVRGHPTRLKVLTTTGGPGTGIATAGYAAGDGLTGVGLYDTVPANPVATSAFSGGGSGATLNINWEPYEPNAIAISPQGLYVAVIAASQGITEFTELWDATSGTLARLGDIHIGSSHGDWVKGTDGDDWYVYIANNGAQNAEVGGKQGIVKVKGSTRVKTLIVNQQDGGFNGWGCHIAGQCSYTYPGWCVVGTTRLTFVDGQQKYMEEIFLLNIDTGEIRRVAHHHSFLASNNGFPNPYWSEQHAGMTWDGQEIFFRAWWTDTQGSQALAAPSSNHQLTGISRSGTTVSVNDPAHGYSGSPRYVYFMEPSNPALKDGASFSDYKGFERQIAIVDANNYTYQTSTSGAIAGASFYRCGRGAFAPIDFYTLKAPAGAYLLRAGD